MNTKGFGVDCVIDNAMGGIMHVRVRMRFIILHKGIISGEAITNLLASGSLLYL